MIHMADMEKNEAKICGRWASYPHHRKVDQVASRQEIIALSFNERKTVSEEYWWGGGERGEDSSWPLMNG